jgi:hypothetical protein
MRRVPGVPGLRMWLWRPAAAGRANTGNTRLSLPSLRWQAGTGAMAQRDGPDRRVVPLRRFRAGPGAAGGRAREGRGPGRRPGPRRDADGREPGIRLVQVPRALLRRKPRLSWHVSRALTMSRSCASGIAARSSPGTVMLKCPAVRRSRRRSHSLGIPVPSGRQESTPGASSAHGAWGVNGAHAGATKMTLRPPGAPEARPVGAVRFLVKMLQM